MRTKRTLFAATLSLFAGLANVTSADTIVKADNADALNLGSSWVGGTAPGTNDVATWDAALTASRTYTLGADLSWLGLAFTVNPGGNVSFGAGYTLTLGAQGIYTTPNLTYTLNNEIVLAADQTWNIGTATFIPAGDIDMGDHILTLSGNGTKQFKGLLYGGGSLVNSGGGQIKFTNAGTAAPDTDVTMNLGTLVIETGTGLAAGPRTKSLTLNGGTVTIGGRSGENTVETNANALTVGAGTSLVTITPNASKSAMFYSASLETELNGGAIVFRGTALGTNTLASLTPNSANVVLGSAPDLTGANGAKDTTTVSILPRSYGDTNLTTTAPGSGLVTYDPAYGVRPLNVETEYKTITDGQSQLDNVRHANTSGSGVMTVTLTQDTTVNSLSLSVSGTSTDGGIVIAGDPDRVLTIASGHIYASQTLTGTPNANDAQLLTVPFLDLNGQEGVIFRRTASVSNGEEPACLDIRSSIRNDGGKGITFVGSGLTYMGGSATSTYTGPTVCQSGNLRISKSVSNIGIPGDLVIKGGTVQNTGNQLPNTSDIYIHDGTYYQKGGALNSGTGTSETFRDLYMTGGTYNDGASGTSSGSTSLSNAVVSGGTWNVTKGHVTTINGALNLSGGIINYSVGDSTSGGRIVLNGALVITNKLSDTYTCMTLGNNAGTANPCRLLLNSDLAFFGHPSNANAVVIAAPVGIKTGQILLNGTRTFDIGDGPAATDLWLDPILTDNGATAGGLTKTGAGTLMLTMTNAYTGATTVNDGALAVNGRIISPVTVNRGATLTGTGVVSVAGTALTVEAGGIVNPGTDGTVGTLTVTGDVSFVSGSVLHADASGPETDLLAVSGSVTAGTVTVQVTGTGTVPRLLMTADSITGTFTTDLPGMVVKVLPGGTELWLKQNVGTLIKVY